MLPAALPLAYGLTEKQAAFVAALVRGSDFAQAEHKAGYMFEARHTLLRLPHVRAAIEQEIRTVLLTEDAPLARQVLHKLVADENTAPRIRVDAAKILLDRAGITPPATAEAAAGDRSIADMTSSQLVAFVAQRQVELERSVLELDARAERASLVNGAPKPSIDATDGPDFLD